jgi:AraC-like DNA-binding protein
VIDTATPKRTSASATASPEFLALLEQACALTATPLGQVLARAGISPQEVNTPGARVPLTMVRAAWSELEELSGSPTVGLLLAKNLAPGSFDLLDYLVQNATTLREAFEQFCRYLPLLANVGSVWLSESGELATLCHHAGDALPAMSQLIAGGVVSRARLIIGPGLRVRGVGFMQRRRAPQEEYEQLLGAPVLFEQPHDTVTFDRSALELPTNNADPTLARILRRQAEEAVSRVRASHHGADGALREVAMELVLSGHASLERMSERLGTTPRTLQRRLAGAGLSHRSLVESVRAELVERALHEGGGNLSALARSLGYATPGSLRRARERWLRRMA